MAIKVCKVCNGEFNDHIRIDGKLRNMQNRRLCLTCSPWKADRLLKIKEEDINIKRQKAKQKFSNYYHRNKDGGIDIVTSRRRLRKKWILSLIGNKCCICGYNRCVRNLIFHHLSDKKFALTECNFGREFIEIFSEILKCVLLCHNCHGEVHDGLVDHLVISSANKRLVSDLQHISLVSKWNNDIYNLFKSDQLRLV